LQCSWSLTPQQQRKKKKKKKKKQRLFFPPCLPDALVGHLAFDFCKVVSSTSAAAGGIEVEMPVLQQQKKMQIGNGNTGKALESIRNLAKILDHFDILTLSQVVSSGFLLQLSFWECFSGDLIDPDFKN
jgi:hypothetical protein